MRTFIALVILGLLRHFDIQTDLIGNMALVISLFVVIFQDIKELEGRTKSSA